MNYRTNKQGEEVSILGFGCMRFQKKGTGIDIAEAEREIMYAIESGVNYFDTAYIYPGSEDALGTILERNHCREKVQIATKLPHYLVKKTTDFEKFFQEELKRLRTDYIDYYLMHMLPDVNVWNHLIELGVLDFIEEKIKSGQIRKLGFSYHGNTDTFIELLDVYDWDFCQVQYNYLDEHSQAGRRGVQAAAKRGIPVIIMEPLRGGRLVNGLPKAALDVFEETTPHRSPAEWAFRWLWNQPEVTVVLSGMNSMEMLEENIHIADEVQAGEQTSADEEMYRKVIGAIHEKIKVPCTGCSYCMPCPFGVDIPGSFQCYNISYADRYTAGFREYVMCTLMKNKRSNVSLCRECGACEKHCPQSIPIRQELKEVRKRFENPIFKIAAFVIKRIYK